MTAAASSSSMNTFQSFQFQGHNETLLEPPPPLGRLLFVLGATWLQATSEAFDSSFNQGSHTPAQGETLSSMRKQNLDNTHVQQTSVIPASAHWNQIRQLSHNVVTGVAQALQAWVMTAPEALSELNNYIVALSQNQVSDTEAVALIQHLDQVSSSQKQTQPHVKRANFLDLFFPISESRKFPIQRTNFMGEMLEPLDRQTQNQKHASSHAVENRLSASFSCGNEPPPDPLKPEDLDNEENEDALVKNEEEDEADQEHDDEVDEATLAAFERAIEKELAAAAASHHDPKYTVDILALQEEWREEWLQQQERYLVQKDPSIPKKAAQQSKPQSKRPSPRKAKLTNAAQFVRALRECYE